MQTIIDYVNETFYKTKVGHIFSVVATSSSASFGTSRTARCRHEVVRLRRQVRLRQQRPRAGDQQKYMTVLLNSVNISGILVFISLKFLKKPT